MLDTNVEQDFESVLLARKLANMIPVSISIDDLKLNNRKRKINDNLENDLEKTYIPPSPKVTTSGNNIPRKVESPKLNKFSFLLKKKSPAKSPSYAKMKYELPNMLKIGAAVNNLKPLMTVSFSNLDFADKKVNEPNFSNTNIIPEARTVLSDGESD